MEYECYELDLSKKMHHVEGAALFASDCLGQCCVFINEKFKRDGIPMCVYQPRWETYRATCGDALDIRESKLVKSVDATVLYALLKTIAPNIEYAPRHLNVSLSTGGTAEYLFSKAFNDRGADCWEYTLSSISGPVTDKTTIRLYNE